MLPYFSEHFGNPDSSGHQFGLAAKHAVEEAREQVADLVGAHPVNVIFTSGATEAINLAILGVWKTRQAKGKHIITSATEHPAVLETCKFLAGKGTDITHLSVDQNGIIDAENLKQAIRADTILIAIMHANNETGVLQDLKPLSNIAHENGILFLSDTTQSLGKLELPLNEIDADFMVLSGHKMMGPKGIGALVVANESIRKSIQPVIHGGGQELGLRSGTLNTPAIVGLGKACSLVEEILSREYIAIGVLRDKLENGLKKLGGVSINGAGVTRLPNTANVSFEDIEALMLIETLQKELAVSTGSACSSANSGPSHVLQAMGLSKDRIHSSIRFSLGGFNTEVEVEKAIELVSKKVRILRESEEG